MSLVLAVELVPIVAAGDQAVAAAENSEYDANSMVPSEAWSVQVTLVFS